MTVNVKDLERRMTSSVESLKVEFAGLRTGRASANLLDPIQVDAYGSLMPLNQCASVSVPEARMLTVTVWDNSLVKAVERSIRESDLGLNPMTEGNTLRIPIPELNEERRKDLGKVAGKYAEAARIAIRNIRRDGMDDAKKAEKKGDISEDDSRKFSDQIQKITDSHVKLIDDALSLKEVEIMQV